MGSFDRNNRGGGRSFGNRSFGNQRSFSANRGGDRGGRSMFSAVCSNCGKECQVPFRPTNGKPVYCSDCFEKMRGGDRGPVREARFGGQNQQPSDNNKALLDSINSKLDKIIRLLEPKVDAVTTSVSNEKTETDAPKDKKVKKTKKVKSSESVE